MHKEIKTALPYLVNIPTRSNERILVTIALFILKSAYKA